MIKNPITAPPSAAHQYDDILNLEYPHKFLDSIKHPRMSNADRAKIFAPFAALKGYEEAIEAKERIVVPKVELSEDQKEELDRKFMDLSKQLEIGEHPFVRVVYFEKNKATKEDEAGSYIEFTGKLVKIIESSHLLQIVDRKIPIENIKILE